MTIPKIVHYCWFGGARKSALIHNCLRTWKQHLSDWELIEWNEANTRLDNDFVREAYGHGLWAMVADYVRLQVLEAHGGLYLDTDVELLRGFDDLISNRCFVGFQTKEERVDWVNNAVLGAEPHHPFLAACMGYTCSFFKTTRRFPLSPTVTTQVLRYVGLREYGYQELDGVTIYPTQYFYPYTWEEEFSESCVSLETHCVHHWTRSWNTPAIP
jgi:mannosyltransferase OCH1-like enzyme